MHHSQCKLQLCWITTKKWCRWQSVLGRPLPCGGSCFGGTAFMGLAQSKR